MLNNVTHPRSDITWHVLGGGAMGCLWAAHIQAQQTTRASLILRDQQALMRYPGTVTLEHAGRTRTLAVDAQYPGSLKLSAPLTHVLVCTKAQDTVAAIDAIVDLLAEHAVIVLLQNGIRVQRELSERFGADRVFCLSTSHGAWLRTPFHVVHAGEGDAWLGQLPPAQPASVDQVLQQLPARDLGIGIDADIHHRLWQKFAVNCAINALTVIHDCPNGELLARAEIRPELDALIDEIVTLLNNIPQAPDIPGLPERVYQVLQQTANNVSSTLQDIRRGRRTEIEHFNGYLCALADASGLPCPLNRQVLTAVKAREAGSALPIC